MENGIYGLLGVVIGVLLKALFDYINMSREHEQQTKLNTDPAEENVRELLRQMLDHKTHKDRTFEALKAKVAGFEEDDIRKMLMAIGAQKVRGRQDGKERYFLTSREEERYQ